MIYCHKCKRYSENLSYSNACPRCFSTRYRWVDPDELRRAHRELDAEEKARERQLQEGE